MTRTELRFRTGFIFVFDKILKGGYMYENNNKVGNTERNGGGGVVTAMVRPWHLIPLKRQECRIVLITRNVVIKISIVE